MAGYWGVPRLLCKEYDFCFLTERALRVSVVAPFPAHADSQPRESRNELPTASCWEMARTGLLCLPGRLSIVHGKGHYEHSASNQSLPWTSSLSPAMGHCGTLQPLCRRGRSHLGVQPGPALSSFQQKSLSLLLSVMGDTELTSSAVSAASCMGFLFQQMGTDKRSCRR